MADTIASPATSYGGVSAQLRHPALRGFDEYAELLSPVPFAAAHPGFGYHGGPVVASSLVYASFWGSLWQTDPGHQQRAARLAQFLRDFLASRYMNILSQYGAGGGAGAAGSFVQSSFVSGVPTQLTDASIRSIVQSAIDAGMVPEPGSPSRIALMIYLDEQIAVSGDPTMCEPRGDTAFGYHNFFTTTAGHSFYYAVMPGLDDACLRSSCPSDASCSLHLAETQEQRLTQVTSHEYSELVTDPELNAWFDATTGAENGDICNGETGTITVGADTWTVQRMYSKADDVSTNGAITCLVEAPTPIPMLSPGPTATPVPAPADGGYAGQPPDCLDRLLPLPAVRFDLESGRAGLDEGELRRYADGLFAPLRHQELVNDFPAFLRGLAGPLTT